MPKKPSAGFCTGKAVISHMGKALKHNSSNNKADFFFPCLPTLRLGKKIQDANLVFRLASVGAWIFIS